MCNQREIYFALLYVRLDNGLIPTHALRLMINGLNPTLCVQMHEL